MNKETAKEYALALFDLALENQSIELVKEELVTMISLFKENQEFIHILTHPRLSKEGKKKILASVSKGLNPVLLNFFFVLIDNNNLEGMDLITEEYELIYNHYNEILFVDAITTVSLTEKELLKLQNELTKRYRQKVEINNIIDSSIIGGIKLLVGNEVIDYTIKNQIENLKLNILRNTY